MPNDRDKSSMADLGIKAASDQLSDSPRDLTEDEIDDQWKAEKQKRIEAIIDVVKQERVKRIEQGLAKPDQKRGVELD